MDLLVILSSIFINLCIGGFVLFRYGDFWKKQLNLEHKMSHVIQAISKLQSKDTEKEVIEEKSEDISNDQMIEKLTQAGILDSVIPASYE